jgi:hypothetical protein
MMVRTLFRSLVFALAFCMVVQPAVYAQQEAPAQPSNTAQPDSPAQPDNSAQMKATLKSIGKGNQAIVTFDDGSTQAGRIKRISDASFSLDEGGKGAGAYLYANVSSVSKPRGSNAGSKVVTIAFATTALVVVAGMVGFAVTKARGGTTASSATPAK